MDRKYRLALSWFTISKATIFETIVLRGQVSSFWISDYLFEITCTKTNAGCQDSENTLGI